MKQKPWSIIILAVAHLFAPIGNIFFSSYVNSIGIWQNITERFQYENLNQTLVFLLVPIFAGYAVFLCKKWSYYVYLVLMSYTIISGTMFWYQSNGLLSIWPLIFLYVMNIAVVSYFLIPAVRSVYFDPRLRWWENKPRYYFEKTAELSVGEGKLKGTLKNISETGAFVMMDIPPKDSASVILSFENEGVPFEVPASVIIHDKMSEIGIGLKFNHTDVTLKHIESLIEKLAKDGKLMENRRYSDEDSFNYWAKKVLTLRGGFIPDIPDKNT